MTYRSDSPWEETDYKPFDEAEYGAFPYDPTTDPEIAAQEERYAASRRRNQRHAHIGGSLIILLLFTWPIILLGVVLLTFKLTGYNLLPHYCGPDVCR